MTPAFRRRFGVQTLFIVLAVAVIATLMIIRSAISYEGMARRDFGSPARITSITGFFETCEKRPRTDFAEVPDDPDVFNFPETRVIPNSAIPKELIEAGWGTYDDPRCAPSIEWQSVLAHYDEKQQLRAIEFYGSRYGALVSRDPALKPTMPGELQQLAGAPIYITTRVSGGD
jgi:hypothetical protein